MEKKSLKYQTVFKFYSFHFQDENDKDSSSSSSSTHTAQTNKTSASSGIRPKRAAAADAAAISEANSELGKKKKGRPRKVPNAVVQERNDKIASSINGLDFLHDTTMRCIGGKCQHERTKQPFY